MGNWWSWLLGASSNTTPTYHMTVSTVQSVDDMQIWNELMAPIHKRLENGSDMGVVRLCINDTYSDRDYTAWMQRFRNWLDASLVHHLYRHQNVQVVQFDTDDNITDELIAGEVKRDHEQYKSVLISHTAFGFIPGLVNICMTYLISPLQYYIPYRGYTFFGHDPNTNENENVLEYNNMFTLPTIKRKITSPHSTIVVCRGNYNNGIQYSNEEILHNQNWLTAKQDHTPHQRNWHIQSTGTKTTTEDTCNIPHLVLWEQSCVYNKENRCYMMTMQVYNHSFAATLNISIPCIW